MKSSNKHDIPTKSSQTIIVSKYSQSGATLIIVLFILILIMVIGAIAIRGSTTDLKVSTAAQVNKLLFQANDAAFMKVEREDRLLLEQRKDTRSTLKNYMSGPGLVGYEVAFCVRPRDTQLFNILKISKHNERGGEEQSNGYCNPKDPKDYVSEGRVITQLIFIRPAEAKKEGVFELEVAGTFSNDFDKPEESQSATPLKCVEFDGYAVSLIPSLATSSASDIAACLKRPYRNIGFNSGEKTLKECLSETGVPFTIHQQRFVNQPTGSDCIS